MRRVIDIGFLFLIALGCLGLDFYIMKRDSKADQFGVAEYIAQRREDFNDMLNPPSLKGAMPSEIAGWDITQSGADQMIGVTDANRQQQANEVALVKAIASLAKASAPAGEMMGLTMVKGDTRLRVVAMLVKESAEDGQISGIETLAQAAAAAPTAASDVASLVNLLQPMHTQTDRAVFDVVDGVAFTELPLTDVTSDPELRMMRATLTDALAVTVVTRSDDDTAIKEALAGIDFVMLNKLLTNPVAGVKDGRTTDLRADEGAMPMAAAQPDVPPADLAAAPAQEVALNAATAENDAAAESAAATAAEASAAAPAPKTAPAETAVFITPPEETAGSGGAPCVRRAGVLVCPDG